VNALVTMYSGTHARLEAFTRPALERYARRHGFGFFLADPVDGHPPSWGKVAALQRLLVDHEVVVWVDADALIFDHAPDLAEWLPKTASQAFAQDRLLEFRINTWLWVARRGPSTSRFLDDVWRRRRDFPRQPWDLGGVHAALTDHPEHQVGTVLLPKRWCFDHDGDAFAFHASAGDTPLDHKLNLLAARVEARRSVERPSTP
jgi:hypothetical protein